MNRPTVRRREFSFGLFAGAMASTLHLRASAAEQPSLKSLAAAKGVLFGSALGAGKAGTLTGSFNDPNYLQVLKDECAVLVPENEFKVYVIAAEQGKYNFEPGDRIAAFARDNGMKLRGHTLLWNHPKYLPKWLDDSVGAMAPGAAEEYLRAYIKQVCGHFGAQVFSWDVVNETLDPKTGEFRDTAFSKVLGFDALRIAFESAREHAPRAQLVYNDFMSWETSSDNHRAGVLKLLEQFKARKVPVDALGIQSHIGVDDVDAAQRLGWQSFLDDVVGMGYKLLITEFDVNDKNLQGDFAVRDARVAAVSKQYFDLMLSYKQLDQVLCWGMADKYSWLQSLNHRTDKTLQRATPYDEAFRAKPLREAMAAAFAAAPGR